MLILCHKVASPGYIELTMKPKLQAIDAKNQYLNCKQSDSPAPVHIQYKLWSPVNSADFMNFIILFP